MDHSDQVTLQWNGIRKYDLDACASLSAWTDDALASWCSEPWFATADRPHSEDQGHVTAFQFNAMTQRETLDVFDARDLGREPVAQVAIPRHISMGFRGCWMAAHRIPHWSAAR